MAWLLKNALRGIRKYPELFSALEEFERTKKIPKFTYRKRVDITLDENLLREARVYCEKNSISFSRVVERGLKKELFGVR